MFNHSYLQSIFEKEVLKISMVMSVKTKGIPSKSAETNCTLPRLIRLLFVCQSTLFFIIMAASHYRINNSETHCKLSTLQVATILVAMTPKILKLATWFVKKVSLNQKNWSPNGDQAKTLTLMVDYKPHFQLFFSELVGLHQRCESISLLLYSCCYLQKALLHGVVDSLSKGSFVTDSLSLGDTKFMVRKP